MDKDNRAAGARDLIRPQSKRSQIGSFIVMDVMSAAADAERAGRDVLHLEVGQPGTPAPATARAMLAERLSAETLGYTLALGMPELRARIARHYQETYGISVPESRIVVTTGSSAAFVLAFLSVFDVGDRIALPAPGYPCYRQVSAALGVNPVSITTGPEDRWMPTVDAVREAAQKQAISGLLIASPANPTGTMLTPGRLREIVVFCGREKIWFISDEIYHGLCHVGEEQTALAYSDDVIVINSFSKYFSMTGWRVGWMVVPEALVPVIERLAQNLYISAPAASQVAAIGAFDATEELQANRATYARNRQILIDGLRSVGLDEIAPADGAFYLYVDISSLNEDSLRLSRRILDELAIAVTPGLDFDAERGQHYLRFSYAGSTPVIEAAVDRLRGWNRLRSE